MSTRPSEGIKEIGTKYVEWMNGIQFYLTEDMPLSNGHTIYIDSPWAITSISQQQFWPDHPLEKYGDGKVRGVISADISNWHADGNTIEKPAMYCTAEEIQDRGLGGAEELPQHGREATDRRDAALLVPRPRHTA